MRERERERERERVGEKKKRQVTVVKERNHHWGSTTSELRTCRAKKK